MDREILFRGKRIDNGAWAVGFVVMMPNTPTTKILAWCESCIIDGEGRQCFNVYEVDPSTVVQYTGLTDKNGTRIFEGDVLRLYSELENYTWTAVVEFGNPNCTYNWGWHLKPLCPCHQNPDILLWVNTEIENIEAEIIGNVHDGKGGQHD